MSRAIATVLLAALAACSTTSVSVDQDETVDFSAYRTFGWWPGPGSEASGSGQPSTLFDRRARREIERVLAAKGLSRSDDPDLRIRPRLRIREVREVTTWDHGSRWRHTGRGFVTIRDDVKGTLVLDVIDARQNALVWRGATGIPVGATGPAEVAIAEAVDALLARFAPGP